MCRAYLEVLKKPGSQWIDVISSGTEVGRRRESLTKNLLSKEADNLNGYYKSLKLPERPNINFILMGSGDTTFDTVMFGWGYQENNQDGHVLMSHDPIVIDIFSLFFEMLCKDSEEHWRFPDLHPHKSEATSEE